jgi:hypothetical protein
MIDALLDIIDALPVDDPAQMHARQWASRVRELQRRQEALLEKECALIAADDLDGFDAAADEFDKVSAELDELCRRQQEVLSRMRPSTDTMQ